MASLKVGIVGLPNAGKSTLFNALLKSHQAQVADYPFTTVEPNVGIVKVPDERLTRIAEMLASNKSKYSFASSHAELDSASQDRSRNKFGMTKQQAKTIPATIEFVDIAGLIRGAHKGEGLGNEFLSHIREVDAVVYVLRAFGGQVTHPEGKIDPVEDLKTLQTEIELADLKMTERHQPDIVRAKTRLAGRSREPASPPESPTNRRGSESKNNSTLDKLLIAGKPALYILNVNETEAAKSPEELAKKYHLSDFCHSESPRQRRISTGSFTIAQDDTGKWLIPICAKLESELYELPQNEQQEYLASLGIKESGTSKLIRTAYELLELITFYTLKQSSFHPSIHPSIHSSDQAQAWPIRRESTALEAAGLIHTDFAKGFIGAEVVGYQDFLDAGGWDRSQQKGLLQTVGRDYMVQDGDVINFKHH